MKAKLPENIIGMTVHDLRNAVNSIQLSLYVVEAELPEGQEELLGDFAILTQTVKQAREMVETLALACKVTAERAPGRRLPAAPDRLLAEVAASVGVSTGARSRIVLQVLPGSPPEVELDLELAHWGLEQAIRNVVAATPHGRVSIVSEGVEDTWRISIISSQLPASSVVSAEVSSSQVQHLLGDSRERRGLDLAIAGWVSERLGGTARLDVEPGCGSRVVLEWPIRSTDLASRAERQGVGTSSARST